MSNTTLNQSVSDLEVARRVLIEERRDTAKMLASYFDDHGTNPSGVRALGGQLQQLQEQIEAVDRALADEKAAAATTAPVSSPAGQPSAGGAPSAEEMLDALSKGGF